MLSMRPEDAAGSPGAQEITTLLGRDSEFTGKLTFEGTVRIDGKFSGEIFAEGVLVVGNGAQVKADISVREVIIQGSVSGSVTATELIEITAPAKVSGKLTTPQLLIEKGATFDGEVAMSARKPETPPIAKQAPPKKKDPG